MPLNAEIYYRYSNEGEGEVVPVILIHGAGGTHLHWPAQIRRLPGHNVYALDLPGHGKSEGRGNQTIESYCHSIIQWMDDIHIFRSVIVGHSMGGAIALTMALQYPERTCSSWIGRKWCPITGNSRNHRKFIQPNNISYCRKSHHGKSF